MNLKSYQQRAKTYMGNAGIYLTASLVSSLLSVLINPLLAKNLSPEDYAVSTYYSSFSTLYAPVLSFFITDFFLRKYYIYSKEQLFQLKGNVLKIFLVFSGIVSLLCFGGLFVFVKTTNVSFDFMPYAMLAVLHSYLHIFFTFRLAQYKIARDSKSYFRFSVIWGVAGSMIMLLFVVVLKWGATGKMLASCVGSFLPFVICLYQDREYLKVKFDKQIFIQIFKYGYPLVLAAMLSYFTQGYDKVLLERNGDIVMLGYYSVACSMAGYISVFSTAIKSTFQPDMYKAISQRNLKKVVLTASLVTLSVGAVVAVFILFCPWLIKILTAGRYVQSTHLCRIVALSTLTSTLYYQISQFTYGTGHSKITLINKIICTVINVFLMMWLIGKYGAEGAAWCTVLGFVVFAIGNVLLLFINRKKLFT